MKLVRVSIDQFLLDASESPSLRVQGIGVFPSNPDKFIAAAINFYDSLRSFLVFNQAIVTDRKWLDEEFNDVFETVILRREVGGELVVSEDQLNVKWPGGALLIAPAKSANVASDGREIEFVPKNIIVSKWKVDSNIYECILSMRLYTGAREWLLEPSGLAPELISISAN